MTARTGWLAILMTLAPGCTANPAGPAYDYTIPAAWAGAVTHPFFPLVSGAVANFAEQSSAGTTTVTVEVLPGTRVVHGVVAVVVRDRVYLNGVLIEDTYDYYAQDLDGNVWYLGEDTKEFANGQVVSTEGSWEWGVDGALPGIIMWAAAAARVGIAYRQEFYQGKAEDWAKVVSVGQTVTVPAGNYTGCITTDDWNGLDPATHELKSYCPGVGLALEVTVGSGEREELISRTTP